MHEVEARRLQEEKIEREKTEIARIAALSEDERIMEEIAKLTDNNEAISRIVTKCLQSKLSIDVYKGLKMKLESLNQWKPAGSKQRKNNMKERNAKIESIING